MKKIAFIFTSSLLFLLAGCQESTRSNNGNYSSNYCAYPGNQYRPECQQNGGYDCAIYPYAPGCQGNTIGGTVGGGTTGGVNPCLINPYAPGCSIPPRPNPYNNYYSQYTDVNWGVEYPFKPPMNCSEPVTPSGIDYAPHETRKGTITLAGQRDYDFDSTTARPNFTTKTSDLLTTKEKAQQFFWADSILKIRFKANLQPSSRMTNDSICKDRMTGASSNKGYGKIRFDITLIGKNSTGVHTRYLGNHVVKVNSCTQALDISSYAKEFRQGMYVSITNVQSNQYGWFDDPLDKRQKFDRYGYVTPENNYAEETWGPVRKAECWSLDIEVASDGTKTFN